MLLAACADHAALEDGKDAFDGVGRMALGVPFSLPVVNRGFACETGLCAV